jgi:hypothetical protein
MMRNGLPDAEPARSQAARSNVKGFLTPLDSGQAILLDEVPDYLVTESMVRRYLEIKPPMAAVIPEYQRIINDIERSYVLGNLFSALSAACDTIERTLNYVRMELHQYHPKIKDLWGKEAINEWYPNIDALQSWGYFDQSSTDRLRRIYRNIRCGYLHSGPITNLEADTLESVGTAYEVLEMFLGFPNRLFRFTSGIECLDTNDPVYKAFYLPNLKKK